MTGNHSLELCPLEMTRNRSTSQQAVGSIQMFSLLNQKMIARPIGYPYGGVYTV